MWMHWNPQTMAFIAPKLIGGENAQTPLNDMGFTKMTQALDLSEVKFQQVEGDMLVTGYLPVSGGLAHLAKEAGCVGGVGLEPQVRAFSPTTLRHRSGLTQPTHRASQSTLPRSPLARLHSHASLQSLLRAV